MIYKKEVSCDTEKLKDIRLFTWNTLKELGVQDKEIHLLVVAVDEVCANLIIHSHHCNTDETIELLIKPSDEELVFEIRDRGDSFNIIEYKEPELESVIRQRKIGGIGLILVKRIIDRIQFETIGSQNICRLFKQVRIAV